MVQFEPFECYCVTNSDYGLLAILGTYATIDYAEIKLYLRGLTMFGLGLLILMFLFNLI